MQNVDTGLSPRLLMDRIYERLRMAYMRVASSRPGDVKTDSALLRDIEAMEVYMQQLTFAYMKKLYTDSSYVTEHAELQELEKILREIADGKVASIRREKYIRSNASNIAGLISKKAKAARNEAEKKIISIQKEKKKLAQEEKEQRKKAA